MISFPNAKINLGLNITEKRSDGFHNIESVFCPIQLNDILEVLEIKSAEDDEIGKITFQSSGIEIPGEAESNLCIKAYDLLSKDFKIPNISVYLHKLIPIGAGLGGGSSDAAFMINMLDELFNLKLTENKKINYSRKLGSDCSFFIRNKPLYAYNLGDKFEEIGFMLNNYQIVIVYPNIQISTKEAYSMVEPKKPKNSIKEIIKLPVELWKGLLKNDFESYVFSKHPEIKKIKDELYNIGAVYASMSGSGSSVYGIFKKEFCLTKEFTKHFIWTGKF